MIDYISADMGPSKIAYCEFKLGGIAGMQLFYGTGDDMVAGPLHGSLSVSDGLVDCFESNISGTVEDITFWGF